jgi:serine/threonine protein kinase
MNEFQPTCDPARIQGCLGDSLSDDERAAFEAHLEVCSACRNALEESAAAATDWNDAREFLSSDVALPIGEQQRTEDFNNASLSGNADVPETAENWQHEAIDGVLNTLGPTDDPRMLGRLGQYEIAGIVGQGGMGVVLKSLDPALNRYVAIKVLAPQLATSDAARQRFSREARAAASVVHENVVAIHAVADTGPLPYFVMPYLRGSSLQKRLDAHGPLGVAEILRVAVQIATGLSAAHAQGLVHRDIKPGNIMLEDGVERLKITDFGLARAADDASLTRTGVIAGTPQFMSPEQARGEPIDSRSDLFSLGSVMYAMCTGFPPFRAETSYGTLSRICDAQPRAIREINPEIPQWLVAVIEQLHEKNPDERFQTAQEVAHLLEQCLAHLRQPDVVPLPKTVVDLLARKTVVTPMRRAVWHSKLVPRQLRRAASNMLAGQWFISGIETFGLIALLIGIGLWLRNRPIPAKNDAAPSPALVVRMNQPSNTMVMMPRSIWNDDITREISELQSDVSRLEGRMSALENSTQESKP